MKKINLLLAILFCLVILATGQTDNTALTQKSSRNDIPEHIRERKAFKRAEWFFNQRAFPCDTIPMVKYRQEMTREIQKAKSNASKNSDDLTWSSVGPAGVQCGVPQWGVVSGRVRAIAVHPTDPLTLYIGVASGGLWKTNDGGQTWQDIGHDFETMCFGAIAIDPNNPETVYAGSGEYNLLGNFNTYPGNGLYKSTDGGTTWMLITNGIGSTTFFSDLAVSPYNSNIVMAMLGGGTAFTGLDLPNEGIWQSLDGGITWNKTMDVAEAVDIAFHPTDPNLLYASVGGILSPVLGFYISTDQGATWVQSSAGLMLPPLGGRIQFDISLSSPNIIYAVIYEFTFNIIAEATRAYKSVDGGNNWTQISPGTQFGGNYGGGWLDQGWYDLCVAVDPDDPNHVLIGNVELHRTIDGSSFAPVRPYGNNAWGGIAHTDFHKLVFAPSNHNYLYIGCDGGVYKSTDKGTSATSQNLGLETLQFYRISSNPTDLQNVIGGMQDNSTAMTTDGGQTWEEITGGDGMECLFSPNPDTIYTSSQYGYFYRSINGGATFNNMYNANGAWVTPLLMHPTNHKTLYTANKRIWKSTNGGNSFQVISGTSNLTQSFISSMAQSQVNPNNMIIGTGLDHPYFDTVFVVQVSVDEGVSWYDVSSYIPGESRWVARVATDPVDENTMYILRTGFSDGNKVWKTTNLGLTWMNISGDLPNLPCSDLFIDPENTQHLYLANDIGVYHSGNGGLSWEYASEGIPYVPAIDFDYVKIGTDRYLRVGTHGRSIYQTLLPNYCLPDGITFTTQEEIDNFQTNYPGCTTIEGDVTINGSDITNLNGLTVLTSIGGDLLIKNNDNLTSLTGLEGLNFIGGDLSIGFISISGGNQALTSVDGLENLNSIGGGLLIYNNPLINLVGLDNLISIGGDLTIHSNFSLTHLTGLDNLTNIGGSLNINFNYSLISITGIENIEASTISDLTINVNTSLSTCDVQSICAYLESPNGSVTIDNNATGCNNPEEVLEACAITTVEEIETGNEITIIPNPANDKITIASPAITENTQLSIFNVNGSKVIEMQLSNNETQIDISALPKGVYFVRVQNEKILEMEKMIIE